MKRIPGLQLLREPKLGHVATLLGMLMFASVHRGAEALNAAQELQVNTFAAIGALALLVAMGLGLVQLVLHNARIPLLVALGGTAAAIYVPSSWALALLAFALLLPLTVLATTPSTARLRATRLRESGTGDPPENRA
ncbi:hypothetical protein ACFONC_03130 [Luteimonas soli]|uniref:Uncharacterized protein n=1 Tax=Luteimonas soli TaxID=1648966 RepID=A0ABV7XIF6_9GAMM